MNIKDINEAYNEKLLSLTESNADVLVFDLGVPTKNVRLAGASSKPMKLYGNKIIKKMKKHGFKIEEIRNLPRSVASPIAVFKNKSVDGSYSILTELSTNDGNFLVTIDLGKDADVDFNIVSSLFGKGKENVVDWINKGKLRYVNKKKAQEYLLHQSAPIAAASAYHALISAAKIVQNFKNPNTIAQKITFT